MAKFKTLPVYVEAFVDRTKADAETWNVVGHGGLLEQGLTREKFLAKYEPAENPARALLGLPPVSRPRPKAKDQVDPTPDLFKREAPEDVSLDQPPDLLSSPIE